MLTSGKLRLRGLAAIAWTLGALACNGKGAAPALSRTEEVVQDAAIPAENGPKLGVISALLEVRQATAPGAASLGVLRAGARVARSESPVSHNGCAGGWFAVRPRGFVCVGKEATLDLAHPTLAAMALSPNLDEKLPFTYARARSDTPLFERTAGHDDAVHELGKLHRRAGMAVVGSWKAKDPSGSEVRLALLSDGHFVRAADLEAAKPSDFAGLTLGDKQELPVAFVVKRGVREFRLEGNDAEKSDLLEYHSELLLSGRFRSLGNVKYWAMSGQAGNAAASPDERWVRHQDVTVVQRRTTFPDFVKDDTRWLDISVSMGTLVAYVGKRPAFVTLVSVARELPETEGEVTTAGSQARTIALGTAFVKRKDLTYVGAASTFGEPFEVADVPWALELSSGQLIHGAYWHDRFGIEHGAGSFELSPSDAARVFRFVQPELPNGWHAATATDATATPVVIRR